ncbi:MAG: hypothetical protein WBN83_14545 [Desulfoprunum sp.]|jgi:hypothetical protein|uniref:hypothetical protein n=1 Tax=Desulfoprunum sp. TaxID=2020866 RepID=UPI00069142A0
MSMQSKLKARGILMLAAFFVLLAVIFMPVFPGKMNGLNYADNLFNMVSKGSSYFIPKEMKGVEKFAGNMIDVKVAMKDEAQAGDTAQMLGTVGLQAAASGKDLAVSGDMSLLLKASLADADAMFNNNGQPVADRYGMPEKAVMYNWHTLFGAISKDLTKQEKFAEAKPFANAQKKALEPSYNYYGVKAMNWKDNIVLILGALGFYVFYTLWYGFGLMYLFEGMGLKIGH